MFIWLPIVVAQGMVKLGRPRTNSRHGCLGTRAWKRVHSIRNSIGLRIPVRDMAWALDPGVVLVVSAIGAVLGPWVVLVGSVTVTALDPWVGLVGLATGAALGHWVVLIL